MGERRGTGFRARPGPVFHGIPLTSPPRLLFTTLPRRFLISSDLRLLLASPHLPPSSAPPLAPITFPYLPPAPPCSQSHVASALRHPSRSGHRQGSAKRRHPPHRCDGGRSTARLDEAPWQRAARLSGFWEYQPADGRPAGEETEVRVWYSANAIYFGIIAHDAQPGAIRATVADRDNIQGDDNVRIYLDTFNDHRRAYFFGVNPLGAQEDGVRAEGGSSPGNITGGTTDLNPDFLWESKGHLTPDGYVVEIRIPFKSLRFSGDDPKAWGIQVIRTVPAHRVPGCLDRPPTGQRQLPPPGRHPRRHPRHPSGRRRGGPALRDRRGLGPAGQHRQLHPRVPADRVRCQRQARLQQLLGRRDRQSRLQPGRERCRTGHAQPALRALLSGKAAVLPGRDRALRHPQPAGVYPADPGSRRGAQDRRQDGAVHRSPI